jgi:hypothetical protein
MAFAVISAARHPLVPLAGASLTRLQDSRHAAGWTVAPPEGAFDTAFRRRVCPPDAGSLLPSLLAVTRTGLTPVGGHELSRDHPNAKPLQRRYHVAHPRCWAHESPARACSPTPGNWTPTENTLRRGSLLSDNPRIEQVMQDLGSAGSSARRTSSPPYAASPHLTEAWMQWTPTIVLPLVAAMAVRLGIRAFRMPRRRLRPQ